MANLTSAIPEGISSYSDYVNQPKTINEEMGQRSSYYFLQLNYKIKIHLTLWIMRPLCSTSTIFST